MRLVPVTIVAAGLIAAGAAAGIAPVHSSGPVVVFADTEHAWLSLKTTIEGVSP